MTCSALRPLAVAALALLLGAGLGPPLAEAQAPLRKVTLDFPALGINQAFAFVADDEGFWKQQGLDVELLEITGTPANLAVATGDVQFGQPSGPTLLQLRSTGQDLIGIVDTLDAVPNEIVLSKDAVARTGLTLAGSTTEQRAKTLKGLSFSDDGSGSGPDVFLRYVAHLGELDPDKDVRITTIPPNAAIAALVAKRVDGFSEVPPWTTLAQQNGSGVIWISALRGDIKGLYPVANIVIAARRDYCAKNPADCKAMAIGVRRALQFIRGNPEKSLADVRAHLKNMDPQLLQSSFPDAVRLLSPDGLMSDAEFANIQDYSIAGGALKPGQAQRKFEGVAFTNEYLR